MLTSAIIDGVFYYLEYYLLNKRMCLTRRGFGMDE